MNDMNTAKKLIAAFTSLEHENAMLLQQKEEWKTVAMEIVEAKNKREAELQTEINKLQGDNDLLREAYAQLTANAVVKDLNILTTKKPKKK